MTRTAHPGPGRTRRTGTRMTLSLAAIIAVVGSLLTPGTASAAEVPTFDVALVAGPVSPTDANNTGLIVGAQVDPVTGRRTPFVSAARGPWAALPIPAGATSSWPVAVNDGGLIAGNALIDSQARAIRWVPGATGYAVQLLPWLSAYGSGSIATGINNAGQIVGARATLLGASASNFGWLHSDTDGLVDLLVRYGMDLTPMDVNNSGVLLSTGGTLDLATGAFTATPPTPASYQGVAAKSLNDAGVFSGDGPSTSQSLPSQGAFWGTSAGWVTLGSARNTFAGDVDALGDVAWSGQPYSGAALGASVYLAGLGSFGVNDLLTPQARTDGWLVTGALAQLTDTRTIVVAGRNTLTGQTGTLLLTPSGQTIPVPATPTGLTATAHSATITEKWVSIDLAWQGIDPNTRSVEVQRSLAGAAAYTTITRQSPGTTTFRDTTVALGTAYDYRIRAVGLSGASDWSAIATATAPAQPLDGTAPVITLTAPPNGSTVSGVVTLTLSATDNVAVTAMRLTVTHPLTGQITELGSATDGGPITVLWDSTGLPPAMFTFYAYASDAMGNLATRVLLLQPELTPAYTMRVSAIDLRAAVRRGVVTATGTVTVLTQTGAVVPGASLTLTWRRPDGSTEVVGATTDTKGRATVSTRGGSGTYTLTVDAVGKSYYSFDAATSILSKSITK